MVPITLLAVVYVELLLLAARHGSTGGVHSQTLSTSDISLGSRGGGREKSVMRRAYDLGIFFEGIFLGRISVVVKLVMS